MVNSNHSHERFWVSSLFRRLVLLVLATLLSTGLSPICAQVNNGPQKKVLAFHLMRSDDTSVLTNEGTYRKVLADGLAGQLDYYSEFVDLARFGVVDYQSALRDFFKQKYKGTDFDLIIAVNEMKDFLVRYGAEVFPNTPVVFARSGGAFDNNATPTNFTGIVYDEPDLRGTLDIIRSLQPAARRVFVVTGTSQAVDKFHEARARRQFSEYGDGLAFTWLSGLPIDELKQKISNLPPDSVVYFVMMAEDGAGKRFALTDGLDEIAAASSVPIYTWHDSYLGHGVVGGKLESTEKRASQVAELALRILRREKVETIPITKANTSRLAFDWRQLQRWKLNENRLPAGAEVLFREATFWQRYRNSIIAVITLLTLQSALIAALLVEKRRRRKAAIGLKASEERNRAILNALPDMMFLQSRDGVYLDYHASRPELLLVPPEQFLGKRMQEVLPPALAREMEACFALAIETGRTQIIEYELLIQGAERWFEARIAPCNGTRLLSVVRDVTERRQAEEDLRKSEERFTKVFKASPQPMSLSTIEDGRYIDVNDRFLELSGCRREELIGNTSVELQHWESRDERQRLVNRLKSFGAIRNVESKFRIKNGELRILLFSADLISLGDEQFVLKVTSDITERKQLEQQLMRSEREFSTLVKNSPDVISRLDRDLRYLYVSPNLEDISGIAAEAFIGKTPGEVAVSDYDWRAFESSCREAIEKRQVTVREFQYRGRHYRTRIIPECSSGGGVESVMSISEDVTERLRAELELRKLTARLFNLQDEERRRIARELHDSTAQTLFAVTMNLRRLEKTAVNRTPEITGLISDSQELTAQSLTELRTLSYLLHPPLLDEAGLVRALQVFVRGFSERSGIHVEIVAVQNINRLPRDIETALFRVVQEALTNVSRHSGSDTATIRVEQGSGEVKLQVSDRGHGMTKSAGNGSAGENAEMGVGISGMRQRLIQLGGRLEIESSNNGTTVTAVVPALLRSHGAAAAER
jgi:PAS domain S-box-containing protein